MTNEKLCPDCGRPFAKGRQSSLTSEVCDNWTHQGRQGCQRRAIIRLRAENARLSEEVRRLKAERQWIRCDERMPEMGERVVVRYFYGRAIAELTPVGFHDADGALRDVTHWVRLPESPK